jgi:hypothetical protein
MCFSWRHSLSAADYGAGTLMTVLTSVTEALSAKALPFN